MFGQHDDLLIMAVAQAPFESNYNSFCKLVPLLYLNGLPASPEEFPNDGEIWWMLTVTSAHLAVPGRLIVGYLEESVRYDENNPVSSRYQVVRDEVRVLDQRIGMEIIDIPGDAIDKLQNVVSGGFTLRTLRPLTPQVLLRWRGDIFGPFNASVTADAATGRLLASFTPSAQDMTVFHFEEAPLRSLIQDGLKELSAQLSASRTRRAESSRLFRATYHLLLAPGYERMLAHNPATLALEPLEAKLVRFARKLIQKKKRRELMALLDELEITGRTAEDAQDLLAALAEAKLNIETQASALEDVTKALLETGVFGEDRIRVAQEAYEQQYVQERSSVLQAQIEERAASKREELHQIERQLSELAARLKVEEDAYRERYRAELVAERQQAERQIANEWRSLEQQRAELELQRGILQEQLAKVTQEWRESGEEVVQRYLSIAPLVERAASKHAPATPGTNADTAASAPRPPIRFDLPAFVHGAPRPNDPLISENEFVDRFLKGVEDSGFDYRRIDVIRFHLSVKTGALTVLGGPSGIGKSSLPLLYGRALAGGESNSGRSTCLMVSVNPSWMDVRDLLGHWNPVEGRFYPAESGLFQYLVFAQEEYRARQASTGIYLTCLDEMNLSQPEYYFSDLMMVLEREGEERRIRAFADNTAAATDPFRAWSTLELPPSIRFVGTVNFDETTRLLSDRFLDRCNMIQLRAGTFPTVTLRATWEAAQATGRMISLADFEVWQREDPLSSDLAALLDEMRPIMQQIGVPISPRVYRAIHQFVSSSGRLLPQNIAFDLQLAQRVVPKIRNLVTRSQLDGLDALMRLLAKSNIGPFDETMPLLEDKRETAVGRSWTTDE
jgi:hypothetical protein